MSSSSFALGTTLAATAVILAFITIGRKRPPGPSPLPLLGNLLQMPKEREWLTFYDWARTYGNYFYLSILGQPILVLNTHDVVSDLLEKRSGIYSSRPRLVMAGDLVGFDQAIALMPYSERFRQLRRLIQRELNAKALEKYWPLHEQESRELAKNLISHPTEMQSYIRHYAGSVILKVTYGYQTQPKDDPFLLLAEKVMQAFSMASQPGAWLVDLVPWLRYLPSWSPGAGFQSTAKKWSDLHMQVINGPYDWAMRNQGLPALAKPNFVSTVINQTDADLTEEEQSLLLWSSASLFGGGADTTVAALSSFFLAMALYPGVQQRGYTEIQKVVGKDRLPSVSDRKHLPYVECIMYEVLRWNPVTPLGVPHMLVEADVYEGYHIPAKTIIMPNIWAMLHEPSIFPEPHSFLPERFVGNEAAVKEVSVAFGFGRRACPGVAFAESSMFVAIATALSTVIIANARDMQGKDITREVPYKTGTISHPPAFTCSLTPRDGAELLSIRT